MDSGAVSIRQHIRQSLSKFPLAPHLGRQNYPTMNLTAASIVADLRALGDPTKAAHAQGFFKTGPDEYGEGDKFLGIRVPDQRKFARTYKDLPLSETTKLLISEWHEARLTALFILVGQYRKGDDETREAIYRLYVGHTDYVNNWDLVDSSAHFIVGPHLAPDERGLLDNLALSESLWERRISMIATYHYIKQDQFADALRIAELLVNDYHDLIHKAVGWMLREIGKRSMEAEEAFLKKHYRTMPRTMLRYAIEKFPEALRRAYIEGRV